jgi:integrase
MRLTQKAVAALELPPGKTDHIEFDDDLPGFGVRLREGGSRVWIYQYKIGSKNRRVTLGKATALRCERARETAANMHAMVRLGRDPAGEKASNRAQASETIAVALRAYIAHQQARLRPRSFAEVERHLMSHARPLHSLPLAKIDRRPIALLLADVAANRGFVTSNRVRASLSSFFAWAMRQGMVDANPVIGTGREEEKSRDRVLTDAELATIWNNLEADDFGAILRLLILTGQRASEIAGLKWSELSDAGDTIELPAERTKNGRAHTVPPSEPAQVILDALPRRLGRDFVFGRTANAPFVGWSKPRYRLDDLIAERTGARLPHWTPHDLRRTCATRMAEIGVAPHIVEAVLNHVSGHKAGVAGIYNRATYAGEKRTALERWAAHVMALAEGRAPAPNIVKMERRKKLAPSGA